MRSLIAVLVLVTVLVVAMVAGDALAAAPRVVAAGERLAVSAAAPRAVFAGDPLAVRAARGATLVLSRDARRSRDDVVLRRGRVPAAAKPGAYRVLSCRASRCRTVARVKVRRAGVGKRGGGAAAAPAPAPAPAAAAGGSAPAAAAPGVPGARSVPTTPIGAAPDPITVTPALQADRRATKTLGPDGGSLTATAADGSSFTLEVPAGALLSEIEIAMTPVGSLPGQPLTRVAAVDLQPHGLAFAEPATLKIAPAQEIPTSEQEGLTWRGTGESLHLRPLHHTRALALDVVHFSGHGVGAIDGAGRATLTQRPSYPGFDRFEQVAAELGNQLRRDRLDGKDVTPEFVQLMRDRMTQLFDEVVKPRMTAAETDHTIAKSAIQLGLGWERARQLMLGDDPALDARGAWIMESVGRIIRNAYDKTYAQCMEGDPAQATRFLAFERQGQLMGIDLPDGLERMTNCLRFDLDVDGLMRRADGWMNARVQVTVDDLPIRVDEQFRLSGAKDLHYAQWSVSSVMCGAAATGVTLHAPFFVRNLRLQFNLFTAMQPDGREVDVSLPPDVSMVVTPGSASERFTLDMCDGSGPQPGTEAVWSTVFASNHQADGDQTWSLYALKGWTYVGEPLGLFAKVRYQRTLATNIEDLTLELRHVPGTD